MLCLTNDSSYPVRMMMTVVLVTAVIPDVMAVLQNVLNCC